MLMIVSDLGIKGKPLATVIADYLHYENFGVLTLLDNFYDKDNVTWSDYETVFDGQLGLLDKLKQNNLICKYKIGGSTRIGMSGYMYDLLTIKRTYDKIF